MFQTRSGNYHRLEFHSACEDASGWPRDEAEGVFWHDDGRAAMNSSASIRIADRVIARHALLDRDIGKHAKLLDVGTAHRIKRSVIENAYDRTDTLRFLNSLCPLAEKFG